MSMRRIFAGLLLVCFVHGFFASARAQVTFERLLNSGKEPRIGLLIPAIIPAGASARSIKSTPRMRAR